MRIVSCVALVVIAAHSASAQKIGQVERGTVRGNQFDILVLSVPVSPGDALMRIRRAVADQSLTLRWATDTLVQASTTRSGYCEGAPGRVPFVVPGSPASSAPSQCRLTVSVALAPDSAATSLRLTGTEASEDASPREPYRITRVAKSWKVLEQLARAIASP